ncbi:MAG: transglutaminase family protein [Pseudomonadota bacterium]
MSASVQQEEIAPMVATDLLEVRHVTRYRYARPVKFGRHRAMFRPHESNDLRLTSFDIDTTPNSAHHWLHDVFSNSKVVMDFDGTAPSKTLDIVCKFTIVRSTILKPKFPIAEFAKRYPFVYPSEQWVDLVALIRPEYDAPTQEVKQWASEFVDRGGGDSWEILSTINSTIHDQFDYRRREEPGVQPPRETLSLGAGSCRDFAVLMLEAVRQLGFAARFVTGYLYDPLTDQTDAQGRRSLQGAGATHAWVQVFLPGAGWVEFDPTNGLIASGRLIRTGVARLPSQAVPLEGSFVGAPDDFLGMDVSVDVRAIAPTLTS